jgi:ligand-binding SRPBCC domain-containing protein
MSIHTFTRSIEINAPQEDVFHFHDDTNNLLLITPPSIKVSILHADPPGKGAMVKLKVTQFGFLTQIMEMEFTAYDAPHFLTDTQRKGKFNSFVQERRFETTSRNTTILTDTLHYELPLGFLGDFANFLFVRKIVSSMFAYRQQKTKELLEQNK